MAKAAQAKATPPSKGAEKSKAVEPAAKKSVRLPEKAADPKDGKKVAELDPKKLAAAKPGTPAGKPSDSKVASGDAKSAKADPKSKGDGKAAKGGKVDPKAAKKGEPGKEPEKEEEAEEAEPDFAEEPSPEALAEAQAEAEKALKEMERQGGGDSTLSRYFREMASHRVLTPQEEIEAAKEVERLEIGYWQALFALPMAIDTVAATIEKYVEQPLAEVGALRKLSKNVQRATGKLTKKDQEKWDEVALALAT